MSHYIGITMIDHFVSQDKMVEEATKMTKYIFENQAEKEIKDNVVYSPNFEKFSIADEKEVYRLDNTDRLYLKCIFDYKFLYWKEYGLLAMIGEYKDIPYAKSLYFQNSCDQNEDYEFWDVIMNNPDEHLNIFRETMKRVQSGDADEDIKAYFEKDDEEIKDMDYYRKWYLYSFIEDTLHIVDYLYQGDVDGIQVFHTSAIDNDHNLAHAYGLAKKVYTDYSREMLEWCKRHAKNEGEKSEQTD